MFDAVFHEPDSTYYIVDVLAWNGVHLCASDVDCRMPWAQGHFQATPACGEPFPGHRFRMRMCDLHLCNEAGTYSIISLLTLAIGEELHQAFVQAWRQYTMVRLHMQRMGCSFCIAGRHTQWEKLQVVPWRCGGRIHPAVVGLSTPRRTAWSNQNSMWWGLDRNIAWGNDAHMCMQSHGAN